MRTRLQGYIGGSPSCCFTGGTQGMHFGMRLSSLAMPSLADYVSLFDDDTAHIGVGMGGVASQRCQRQGTMHIVVISCRKHLCLQPGNLFTELADIGEAAIDRGEADISYLIEPLELLHHQITNKLGIHFPLTGRP